MPVSVETAIDGPFFPNGTTVAFPFTFKAASASEVVVIDQDAVPLSSALYSVSIDDDEGGTVTFSTAPVLADYDEIYVVSNPEMTQSADFGNTGPSLNTESITRAFDKAAVRDIRLNRRMDGALRGSIIETLDEIPAAAERMNKYLKFDNAGQPDLGDALGAKGDPGGNILSIGLFTDASGLTIPAGTDLVQTSGYDTVGVGQAQYAYDAEVDAAYVVANPRTSFVDTGGRGFKLHGGLVITADVDGIDILPDARVPGGTVDARAVANYSAAAVLIDGVNQPSIDDYVVADNLRIFGPDDSTGVGILLKATDNNNDKVTFSKFRGGYVQGFYSGLKIEATAPVPSNAANAKYVNANRWEGHFYGCVRAIDIRCPADINTGATGNVITSIVQPNGSALNAERAIYDEGESNVHFNFTYDWTASKVAAGSDNKAIEIPNIGNFFGGRHLIFTNISPWKVWDNTATIVNRSRKIFYGQRYNGFGHFASAPFTSSFADPVGNQDDFLVAADKRFTLHYQDSTDRVSWSAGSAPGTPINMFRLNTGSSGRSRITFAAAGYKRILVDLGANKKIQGLWAAFQDVNFPDTVTLRYSATATADETLVAWTDAYVDVPGSKFVQPYLDGDFIAGQVRWLCFEFYMDAAGNVDVERLSAWGNGEMGYAYLPRAGGDIFGALNFGSATTSDRAVTMLGIKVLGDQGAAITDAAAFTSANAATAAADPPTQAEFNAFVAEFNKLRTDAAAVRTALNTALARLRSHGLIAT